MIKNLKDLKATIALCRKLGVDSIKIGDIEFHLGSPPTKQTKLGQGLIKGLREQSIAPGGITEDVKIDVPDELTPDQLLNWSVRDNSDDKQMS